MNRPVDTLIIGAGAAGMMCALTAAQRNSSVVLLDHSSQIGRKIAISGGGRCNFTNLFTGPNHYISQSPDFCKSALARYTPHDFLSLIEKNRISYCEKAPGQLFCQGNASQITEMLLAECRGGRVNLLTDCRVSAVRKPDRFVVETNHGNLDAHHLVIATGGLSFPKLGATGFGHALAVQFGHRIIPPRPGLVPLTLPASLLSAFSKLSGVSLPVRIRTAATEFTDQLLFTHRGISGPATLQISSFWEPSTSIEINLLPEINAGEWLISNKSRQPDPVSLLAEKLPRRLAELWMQLHPVGQDLRKLKNRDLASIGESLNRWIVKPSGTEGFAKAEVTSGGVDTSGLCSKTMRSRLVPNLYFIGEVVDVTGWLGGFNFQWAWSSGHAAGESL